jgi:hypothetical protein
MWNLDFKKRHGYKRGTTEGRTNKKAKGEWDRRVNWLRYISCRYENSIMEPIKTRRERKCRSGYDQIHPTYVWKITMKPFVQLIYVHKWANTPKRCHVLWEPHFENHCAGPGIRHPASSVSWDLLALWVPYKTGSKPSFHALQKSYCTLHTMPVTFRLPPFTLNHQHLFTMGFCVCPICPCHSSHFKSIRKIRKEGLKRFLLKMEGYQGRRSYSAMF